MGRKNKKVLHPADMHRKKQRKRELKRNKGIRKQQREVILKSKTPDQIRVDIKKINRLEQMGEGDSKLKQKRLYLEKARELALERAKAAAENTPVVEEAVVITGMNKIFRSKKERLEEQEAERRKVEEANNPAPEIDENEDDMFFDDDMIIPDDVEADKIALDGSDTEDEESLLPEPPGLERPPGLAPPPAPQQPPVIMGAGRGRLIPGPGYIPQPGVGPGPQMPMRRPLAPPPPGPRPPPNRPNAPLPVSAATSSQPQEEQNPSKKLATVSLSGFGSLIPASVLVKRQTRADLLAKARKLKSKAGKASKGAASSSKTRKKKATAKPAAKSKISATSAEAFDSFMQEMEALGAI